MSPEKIACTILDKLAKEYGDETFVADGYGYYDDAVRAFAQAIQDAVAEERKTCADLIGEWDLELAKAIRKRTIKL